MKSPDVRIDMSAWFHIGAGGCAVCMAGAVMLQEFKLSVRPRRYTKILSPFDFPGEWTDAFIAINNMRDGGLWTRGEVEAWQDPPDGGALQLVAMPEDLVAKLLQLTPVHLRPTDPDYIPGYRAVAAALAEEGF